jgi:hypothetical protein
MLMQPLNLKNPSHLRRLSLKTILICRDYYLGAFAQRVLAIARHIFGRQIAILFFSESFRNPDEAENCCQGQHAALQHRYPSLLPNIELFSLTRESRRFTASHHRRAADRGQWRKATVGYWTERFIEKGIPYQTPEKRFGESVLPFTDQDGMALALVGIADAKNESGWSNEDIPSEHAIRGLQGVTLLLDSAQRRQRS